MTSDGGGGSSSEEYDVVVVGAGIMGSCAAYAVAKRGVRVLLLEQFDFLHNLGSSHGESRTIRDTYPESYYPPLVAAARLLWEEAQEEAGYRVIIPTHHLDVGPAGDRSLKAAIACAEESVAVVGPEELSRMFSGAFLVPDAWIGAVGTMRGGVIKPTKAVAMFQALALKRGAVIRDRMKVTSIAVDAAAAPGFRVQITTAGGEVFRAGKCVVTAGAWTSRLLKSVGGAVLPIQPMHTLICYWKIKEEHEAELTTGGGFPTFASYGDPYIYGTPSLEYPGLIKVAVHGGRPVDPDQREWKSGAGDALVEPVRRWIQAVMPNHVEASEGPVMTQPCMYSMTPDEDFVIDFAGGEFGKDVVVAGGFSGHGFKMGPAVGKLLAEMAVDGEISMPGVDMGWFSFGRFEKDPDGNAKDYHVTK